MKIQIEKSMKIGAPLTFRTKKHVAFGTLDETTGAYKLTGAPTVDDQAAIAEELYRLSLKRNGIRRLFEARIKV
jgi:hypothetical protein